MEGEGSLDMLVIPDGGCGGAQAGFVTFLLALVTIELALIHPSVWKVRPCLLTRHSSVSRHLSGLLLSSACPTGHFSPFRRGAPLP